MAQDPKAALRAKLSFEQQSRFDALYDRQTKKQGTATVLSMPVLGTFGLEQFYLGNVGSGIIRVLFSWTLIPTVLALFEVISGDLKKQVAHANARVAQRVYDEVISNTPSPASASPDIVATVITPSAVAEAAAFAAEVPIAPTTTEPGATALPFSPAAAAEDAASTMTPTAEVAEVVIATVPETTADAAPTATEVAEVDTEDRQEDVATTTAGAFTVTESAAAWQQGMDAPVVASDEQTFTVGGATESVTDSDPVTTAYAAEVATPTQPDSDAEPLASASATVDDVTTPAAEEGMLVFVADEEPLATETVTTTTVTTPEETLTETVDQQITQAQQTDQVAIAEAEHVETQHYHHGKLVEASRHDIKLTGEVSSLLTDTATDTLVQEVEERSAHGPGWLDVSPLQPTATTSTPASSPAAASATSATDSTSADAAPAPSSAPVTPTPASEAAPAGTTDAAVGTPSATPSTDHVLGSSIRIDGGTTDSGGNGPTTGTDVPGGGLGGPATNVPGGAVGDPGTDPGTNVPSGGISSPTAGGGDTGGAPTGEGSPEHRPTDGTIPT